MLTYVYEADVEMIPNHFVRSIRGNEVEIFNVYQKTKARRIKADAIVMATARSSETRCTICCDGVA